MSASQAGRRGFDSHRPLHFLNPPPDIKPIFLLQWGFLYVRNFVKIIVYVSDEWADAHFFFPKRLAKKGCTIVAGSGLGIRAVMPGESGAMHPYIDVL